MGDEAPWGSIPFPSGANDTDTEISGSHFNLTTLEENHYWLFSNRTLSNGSSCFLVFDQFTPTYLFPNGTFQNSTSCWQPYYDIGPRGKTGIGLAVFFVLGLLLTMACLRKHGKLYLPTEKRFFPISRRWQWYWGLFVCTMALISLFMNIDVDRYYIIEIPIILTSFFWYLMQLGALALVWEAVRHWASWLERQKVDPDPFSLRQGDRRSRFEFWLPLWFYLWLWISFFLVIPRNWTSIKLQRSPEQVLIRAEPAATDARFKAGAFVLLVCWISVVVSVFHSLKHYKPKYPTLVSRIVGFFRDVPTRFFLIIILALFIIGFQIACTFVFNISPLKVEGSVPAIYAGGYGPSLVIVYIQNAYGFMSPNEDRELIRQRRARGEEHDRELGIVHKPSWWRRLRGNNQPQGMMDIIAQNAEAVSGTKATEQGMDDSATTTTPANGHDYEKASELTSLQSASKQSPSKSRLSSPTDVSRPQAISVYSGKSGSRRSERTMQYAAGVLFPSAEKRKDYQAELMEEFPPRRTDHAEPRTTVSHARGGSNGGGSAISEETTGVANAPPQRIRSMLDV